MRDPTHSHIYAALDKCDYELYVYDIDSEPPPCYGIAVPPLFASAAGCEAAGRRLQPFSHLMKANVYIDGFNLYYGCLKGTPHKWLDLSALCRLLLPGDQINKILYFTARVKSRPGDPGIAQRQQFYLRALQTIPNLSIHEGQYNTHAVRAALVHPPPGGPRTVEVWRTEEKGSDVNLATHLLVDAFDHDCEMSVVISNDSDLVRPVQVLRDRFGLTVGILHPHTHPSIELLRAASFCRPIRAGPLRASQFPQTMTDSNGTFTKPPSW